MVTRIGDITPPVPGVGGGAADKPVAGKDFASFVQDAAETSIDTMYKGETLSKAGIAGTADLTEVVAAVNDAELTLQTVTALRDKLVSAYQEIIRMPI
ncbi:flagellar hook-basal body complex protein FliE [Thalassobaculum sp.]|uniref:flagellar hook-basal body complex protein FliE n=1 Tax=Thalassobaculum sp. TaxID=2022740 RepID=UPI003B5A3858